ncbi:MltA domain protein [Desulfarculus baarsii DSM 2075]|uniref:peptidoglycan lytic exotransglycosylase n=1 Tax=Desulfarculus baarsii (strain ATCC 33931 / DSM 2075 / LMG 7858 / VKM B-1802 / 2st14) TaxID=644282 RepID=E1QKA2_DESB2|nr:MltA domain protein [Desulfarculus baarsii DSM 2075]
MKCLRRSFAPFLAGALFLLALTMIGCAKPEPPAPPPAPKPAQPPAMSLERVPPGQWPLLIDDTDAASLREACQGSLRYLAALPPERPLNLGGLQLTAEELAQALRELQDIVTRAYDPARRTALIQERFDLWRSIGSDGQGGVLFTGYYEPIMAARHRPDATYDQPIYGVPPGLLTINLQDFRADLPDRKLVGMVDGNRVVPFHDREAIDFDGALVGKAPILGYAAEPVEVFFLHIQGSGQLVFEDGQRLRVGYAAVNGHPYRAIGRLLLDEGAMEPHRMSKQGIQRYLAAHPEKLRRVLSYNPSYVFFRPLETTGGPLGCYGIGLTGGRSIATDRRIFGAPAMAYVETTVTRADGGQSIMRRFMMNQDTGGAIRGPGRVDVFFGTGDMPGRVAGRMKNPGRLYFLLPKQTGARP